MAVEKMIIDKKYKRLTRDDEHSLCCRIKTGDRKALNELVELNIPFARKVSRNYINQGVLIDDLNSAGFYGLIQAAKRFDASKNFKFISYAIWWIRQAIMKEIHHQGRIVAIPDHFADVIYNVRKMDTTGLSNIEIRDKLKAPTSENLVKLAKDMHDKHDSLNGDFYMSDSKTEKIEMIKIHDKHDDYLLKKSIEKIIDTLKEKEKIVVRMRYGFNKENYSYTLEETSKKLNVTRERVRQIEAIILKKLRPKIKEMM